MRNLSIAGLLVSIAFHALATATPAFVPSTCLGNADCDDGAFCNGIEFCLDNLCEPSPGDPCAGGAECARSCNEDLDICADPAGGSCNDEQACTEPDTCDGAGGCSGMPKPCPAGEQCDPTSGECIAGACCQVRRTCVVATASECAALGGESKPGQICLRPRCVPPVGEQLKRANELEFEALDAIDSDLFGEAILSLLEATEQLDELRLTIIRTCMSTSVSSAMAKNDAISELTRAMSDDRFAVVLLRGHLRRGKDLDRAGVVRHIEDGLTHKFQAEQHLAAIPGCIDVANPTTTTTM